MERIGLDLRVRMKVCEKLGLMTQTGMSHDLKWRVWFEFKEELDRRVDGMSDLGV